MKLSQETILKWMREKANRPMKFSELARCFSVSDTERRKFRHLFKTLVDKGAVVKMRGAHYGLPDEMNLITGTLQGNPNGYGFLIPDDPDEQDVYIGPRNMAKAMHLDRVMVRTESRQRFSRPEGRVFRILERKTKTLVGTFENLEGHGWVVPSESKYFHDIFIPSQLKNKTKPGQLVCAEIIEYPTRHQPPTGKIVEIFGYADDPEAEIRSIFRKYELSTDFSYEVLEEARRLPKKVDADERRKRRDLSGWTLFTIDGKQAKDFDDAVSIEKTEKGFQLGVHIADVSFYVEEDSYLDREAYNRGTSVYYLEGVIPMLPFELSNDLCSLKPHVERPAVSVLIDYDEEGNILNHQIFNSLIKSCRRFTYTEVWQLLQFGDPKREYADTLPSLQLMHYLSQTLRQRRIQEGSVDFFLPEPEIHVNPDGRIERVTVTDNNAAHQLIEEFMLAVNRVVAKHLNKRKILSIHRIHAAPDAGKLEDLNEYLETLGLHIPHVKNVKTADLQKLLKKVQDKPYERVINNLLLRAMKKAEYSKSSLGHFCLNFEHYTHFTSPIRRYPDLIVHRILKTVIQRKPSENKLARLEPKVSDWAGQSSIMERKAQDVEREIQNLRRAQFMEDKIGQKFDGVITSVTAFGFFVELEEYFLEGLVRLSSIVDDYYLYMETEHKLKGKNGFKTFQIGDKVNVRVAAVRIARRQIEFTLTTPSG